MTNTNRLYDTTPCLGPTILGLYPSSYVYSNAWILVKFWIINLMTKPNRPYHTTSHLDLLSRDLTLVPRFI